MDLLGTCQEDKTAKGWWHQKTGQLGIDIEKDFQFVAASIWVPSALETLSWIGLSREEAKEPASREMGPRMGGMESGCLRRVSLALLGSQRVLVVGNGTGLTALFAVNGFY